MRNTWFEKWLDRALLVGAILIAAAALSLAQTDSAKVPSPEGAPVMLPSHRSGDSVAVPTGPDTDTIFDPKDWMVIESHHRMYPSFLQIDTVKPRERFQIGEDGPYAEIIKFVADLKVTMKGEKTKMSDTLYNPAVLIRVTTFDSASQKDSVIQESWAFYYGGSPHFSRQSFFAFMLRDFGVANPKYIKPPEGKK
jgi:hypothetical protein